MKIKFINEILDGDKIEDYFLIQQINKGVTSKGAPYLSMCLQDSTGSLDAKYWNVSEELLCAYKPGMLVKVVGEALAHNKQVQLRVNAVEIQDRDKFDLKDYLKASYLSRDELKTRVNTYLSLIDNIKIKTVCEALIREYDKYYFTYPAASKNHHDFIGGLATHVVEMLDIAKAILANHTYLNKDLLYAGILLHDLGKVIELSGPVLTEYTLQGKLLGHISIMQTKIELKALELGIEGEEIILLRHMTLSHHGVYEYGSPVLPLIPEAEILYLIDNIDARLNSLEKAMSQTEDGDFSQRIYSLESRSFYKSNVK